MKSLLSLILLLWLFTCHVNGQPEKLSPGEHTQPISYEKIWYHVLGDGKPPYMLMLHGGPGGTSHSLYALAPLSDEITLILMDQPGTGRSGNMTDTSLMKIDYFVQLLDEFTDSLMLKSFILYGHSWGTMLGLDYYFAQPGKVEALVMNSPLVSTKMWEMDADTLIATLHDSIQQVIAINEARKTFDDPGYRMAMYVHNKNFISRGERLRLESYPPRVSGNRLMYNYMWGPSEFHSTGNLKQYDLLDMLPDIAVPTLWVTGEFDEARPPTVRYFHNLTPDSEFAIIPDAAHATMHDNREENVRVIRDFLKKLNQKCIHQK